MSLSVCISRVAWIGHAHEVVAYSITPVRCISQILCTGELAFVHGRCRFLFSHSIWHHPFDLSMASVLDCVCVCGVKYDR
jgi:hypothetical protein